MLSWFKRDPAIKLEKEIRKKMEVSMEFQRNGKIKEYAEASQEIEVLQQKLEALREGG